MSVLMRSVSGIRGIVGDTLTPTVLTNHVKAFLEVTGARKVVIGRDSRPTGEAIVSYVSGLCRLAGALPAAALLPSARGDARGRARRGA